VVCGLRTSALTLLPKLTSPPPIGLSRLEYRGYDSAGVAVDGDQKNEVFTYKEVGKVAKLKQLIEEEKPNLTKVFDNHAGIAHTRWPPTALPAGLTATLTALTSSGHSPLFTMVSSLTTRN
jgi:glutamine phosphoribosylpyrophosphate amidotransferase